MLGVDCKRVNTEPEPGLPEPAEKRARTENNVLSTYPDLILSTGTKLPQVQFGTYKMKKILTYTEYGFKFT